METKNDIFSEHLAEWLAAKGDRRRRGELGRAIAHIANIHRKSVSRSFRRVQMQDAEAAGRVFELLMGNEVAPRREFIIDSSGQLSREAIDA